MYTDTNTAANLRATSRPPASLSKSTALLTSPQLPTLLFCFLSELGVDILRGDFKGSGNYGANTAASSSSADDLSRSGVVLELMRMEPDEDIWPVTASMIHPLRGLANSRGH